MSDNKIKLASNDLTSIDTANYTVKAVISDESEDRHGEIVVQDGWDFQEYKNNPIVLFGHDASAYPIGKTLDIEVNGSVTTATMQFAVDENPEAKTVWNLVKGGYLKTISVGFINVLRDGAKLLENKLLEISVVPVPANPNAITLAAETGVIEKKDLVWLRDSMSKELDSLTSHIQKHDNKKEDESMDNNQEEANSKIDALAEQVSKLTDAVTAVLDKVEIKPEKEQAPVAEEAETPKSDEGSQEESEDKVVPTEDATSADDVDTDDEELTEEEATQVTQAVADALAEDLESES